MISQYDKNSFLIKNDIQPTHKALKNKGTHLLFKDMGLKSGLLLESKSDKRIFFKPFDFKVSFFIIKR